jgi:Protein of unknown function (DUF1761)
MVKINFLVAVLAAIIPLIVGSLWYNPKTFALAWMREAEISEEKLKGANMPLIFGLTFVFSFFLAVGLHFLVIHQIHLGSIVLDPVLRQISPEGEADIAAFMAKYGSNYRTFKHGMLHGGMTALMFALPCGYQCPL